MHLNFSWRGLNLQTYVFDKNKESYIVHFLKLHTNLLNEISHFTFHSDKILACNVLILNFLLKLVFLEALS